MTLPPVRLFFSEGGFVKEIRRSEHELPNLAFLRRCCSWENSILQNVLGCSGREWGGSGVENRKIRSLINTCTYKHSACPYTKLIHQPAATLTGPPLLLTVVGVEADKTE